MRAWWQRRVPKQSVFLLPPPLGHPFLMRPVLVHIPLPFTPHAFLAKPSVQARVGNVSCGWGKRKGLDLVDPGQFSPHPCLRFDKLSQVSGTRGGTSQRASVALASLSPAERPGNINPRMAIVLSVVCCAWVANVDYAKLLSNPSLPPSPLSLLI